MGETQKANRNPNPNLKNIEFRFVCLFFFSSFFFLIWLVLEPCYRVFGVASFITYWQKQRNLKVPIWVTGTESKPNNECESFTSLPHEVACFHGRSSHLRLLRAISSTRIKNNSIII